MLEGIVLQHISLDTQEESFEFSRRMDTLTWLFSNGIPGHIAIFGLFRPQSIVKRSKMVRASQAEYRRRAAKRKFQIDLLMTPSGFCKTVILVRATVPLRVFIFTACSATEGQLLMDESDA